MMLELLPGRRGRGAALTLCLLLALLALLPAPALAATSRDSCTGVIASLPAVITGQGIWCLAGPLSTDLDYGRAIDIRANNVTLDCNGHTLMVPGFDNETLLLGVYASGRTNITVRNCRFKGFLRAVQITGTGSGHLVTGNTFQRIYETAIWLAGDGVRVEDNRVSDVGLSLAYRDAYGIRTQGSAQVRDNQVTGVHPTAGTSWGIVMEDNREGSAIDNVITSVSGTARYLAVLGDGRASLRGNVLRSTSATAVGIWCGSAQARAVDNVIVHPGTAIVGCSGATNWLLD